MKPRVPVTVVCWLMLAAVWLGDLASPQLLVVAILLTTPVALSLAACNMTVTWQLAAAALAANASAAWFNAYMDHQGWQIIAVADRGLVALAILLVGVITVYAVRQTQTAREFSDRNARSELMRDLISTLAHDLRTPLSAARLTLRQAYDGAYGTLPATYREVLQRSIASNEDVTRLAETLLAVARYEAGEQSPARETLDLAGLCAGVSSELQPIFVTRSVTLTLDADPAAVDGNAADLRRAITNLVANAVYNTPSGGVVKLVARATGRYAVLSVEDNGYGVAEDVRAQMFDRGAGLGLYIVRRIVEAHSGTITYEPRASGGSRFTIALPLALERMNA